MILCDGNTLTKDVLPLDFDKSRPGSVSGIFDLKEVEKQHLKMVLSHTAGNKTKAASLLGIGVSTLYRKMEEFKITD